MSEVEHPIVVGSVLIDNDTRRKGQEVTVIEIFTHANGDQLAVYQSGRRKSSISFNRIHTDGKARATGWNLKLPSA